MRVVFKAYASLMRYLPSSARNQQVEVDVPEDASPLTLLERFNVPDTAIQLVLVNGVFVPPEGRHLPLREGDEVAVWPPIAGG